MIRRFFRHIKESFKGLGRNGWMSFAAITTVAVTLTLVGLFASLIVNAQQLSQQATGNIRIAVFLSDGSTDPQETTTDESGNQVANPSYHAVYNQIEALNGVTGIEYSSKEQELARLGDTYAMLEGDENPLQDVYYVSVSNANNVSKLTEQIQAMDGVDSAQYGGDTANSVISFANYIQFGGTVATVILLLVAIFLISNTVRITIMSRGNEIQIMRLVGAKKGYIRAPFFFEGAWIGLIGAILPAAVVSYVYILATESLASGLAEQNLSLYPVNTFLPIAVGAIFGAGIIIGAYGSLISTSRFLKI